MEVTVVPVSNGWKRAYVAALQTIHKTPKEDKEPSAKWKKEMLLAEHSPIRLVEFDIYIKGIPSYVATHLVRHHMGCEKFVATQRTDRTGIDRDKLPQDNPVDMIMSCNAQSLINISRKRLCNRADDRTQGVWIAVKEAIRKVDPVVASCMVRECIYKGFCPEAKSCLYATYNWYQRDLKRYREEFE